MAQVQTQPTLVEQVVNAIVSEIVDGDLPANSRLIQDELARAYGVSRQPVQQALLLLRDRGLVRDQPPGPRFRDQRVPRNRKIGIRCRREVARAQQRPQQQCQRDSDEQRGKRPEEHS